MDIYVITPNDDDFKPLFEFYEGFFPKIERNTFESLCGYYDLSDDVYQYESIIVKDNDRIVGGCYVNHFKDINLCFIEFIFVDKEYRNRNVARKVIQFINDRFSYPTLMIETEKDGKAQFFWNHIGFNDIQYDYVQPPIVEGNEPFDGLKLMSNRSINDVEDVLVNHYWKYSFC